MQIKQENLFSQSFNGTQLLTRPKSKQANSKAPLLVFFLSMMSWAFDFKSEGAGQGAAIQGVYLLSYISLFVVFFIVTTRKSMNATIVLSVISSAIFLAIGSMSGLLRDGEVYTIVRNGITVIIYMSSMMMAYILVVNQTSSSLSIRKALAYLSIIYMLATLVITAVSAGGIDPTRVRYQIIGGSVSAGVAYAALSFRFRLLKIEILAATLAISVVLLSVTRTWIAVFAFQTLLILLFAVRVNARLLVRIGVAVSCLLITIVMLEAAGVPVMDRWTERLFITDKFSVDPTSITRERQIDSMENSIKTYPFFGSGLDGESSFWLEKSLGGSDIVDKAEGFGHNQYISVIFIAGLVGGLPLLLMQLWHLLLGIGLMFRTRRTGEKADLPFVGLLGSLIVAGSVAYGAFGGTFESRPLTIWYGAGTGLLIAVCALVRQKVPSA